MIWPLTAIPSLASVSVTVPSWRPAAFCTTVVAVTVVSPTAWVVSRTLSPVIPATALSMAGAAAVSFGLSPPLHATSAAQQQTSIPA